MKIGIYPGSFNPWHEGHEDILTKASVVFDKIIIAQGVNPEKAESDRKLIIPAGKHLDIELEVKSMKGLLVDFVKENGGTAVVRGLRNGYDLQYEMNQQYWNEDLGLHVPIVYFICSRELSHISSSAIRALRKFDKDSE